MRAVETYVHQSIAGSGFAVLDSAIAASLRPDLWGGGNAGLEAAGQFARSQALLSGLPGVRKFIVRLVGDTRDIPVVARSSAHLAQRIEWVIGRDVLDLIEIDVAPAQPHRAVVRSTATIMDRFPAIKTAEPGRSCSTCDNITAGHRCRKAEQSGYEYPAANIEHRCPSYEPSWDALDRRNGRQLWPDVV